MDSEGAGGKTTEGEIEWRQRMEARLNALEASQLVGLSALASNTGVQQNPLATVSDVQDASRTEEVLQASSATAGLAETIIMRTVAGMRGHPANVHQVTAALLKSTGKGTKTARYTVGSFFLVLMQTAVCFSVLTTSQWPSCNTSKDCERHRGGWCSPDNNSYT
eukprot:SAG31_NODE_3676_length_3997_cov_5.042842_4_plen_164_part_00